MLYTGFGAHKLINFNRFLALQAQIRYGGVSVCKEPSEHFYTGRNDQRTIFQLLIPDL